MKNLFLLTISMFLSGAFAQSARWPAEAGGAWIDNFSETPETRNIDDIRVDTNSHGMIFYNLNEISSIQIDEDGDVIEATYCDQNIAKRAYSTEYIKREILLPGQKDAAIYISYHRVDQIFIINLSSFCNNKFSSVKLALYNKSLSFSYKYQQYRSFASAPMVGMNIPMTENPLREIAYNEATTDIGIFSNTYNIITKTSF